VMGQSKAYKRSGRGRGEHPKTGSAVIDLHIIIKIVLQQENGAMQEVSVQQMLW